MSEGKRGCSTSVKQELDIHTVLHLLGVVSWHAIKDEALPLLTRGGGLIFQALLSFPDAARVTQRARAPK